MNLYDYGASIKVDDEYQFVYPKSFDSLYAKYLEISGEHLINGWNRNLKFSLYMHGKFVPGKRCYLTGGLMPELVRFKLNELFEPISYAAEYLAEAVWNTHDRTCGCGGKKECLCR